MKTRLWWAATVLLTLGIVGQLVAARLHGPASTAHASWIFHPKTFQEVRSRAKAIVLAEVVAVKPGADIVTAAPGEPNGQDRIPTQEITLRVVKAYKGNAQATQQLTLFQTGGAMTASAAPAPGQKASLQTQPQFILEGDPLYQVGEQYLLMLEGGPNGLLRTVAPEGRYRLSGKGALEAMVDNAVTQEVRSQSLAALERTLVSDK